MSRRIFISAALVALLWSNSASAAVDEKYKKGWESAFQYIEDTFTEAMFVGVTLEFLPVKYVPYLAQGKKILAREANKLTMSLKPLGIDSSKYIYTEFDTVQLLRVLAAIEFGSKMRLNAAMRGELLAYSLCPWMQPQCTEEVKGKIYERRGWKV